LAAWFAVVAASALEAGAHAESSKWLLRRHSELLPLLLLLFLLLLSLLLLLFLLRVLLLPLFVC
jgi:hypothetical protein